MAKATLEWRVEALRGCMSADSNSTFWIPPNQQECDWFNDMKKDGYIDGDWRTHYDGDKVTSGFTNLHVTPAGEKLVLDFDSPKVHVSDVEHTLWSYWRLADWEERFGMVGLFSLVFLVGYLCAKESFISRLIDLVRSIKP